MRSGDELLIIDDASTDDSWGWLNDTFDARQDRETHFNGEVQRGSWSKSQKKGSVLLLRNAQNLRFGMSCNAAISLATQPLVFLLNSDVSPYPNTIEALTKHFQDDSVFAVGCLEHEVEQGKSVNGGKNVLTFSRGMFIHNRAADFSSGETAWASGGSSMFDRQKWLELGGFDPDYYPAYWEDVDVSYRAKKHGWKVLFSADAEVDHNHESTNTTAFGQKKMARMSWRHAQTFVAKNATWKQKLQYVLWQPYWWLKGPTVAPLQLQLLMAMMIVLVAAALRFYKLAEVPHGMTWDEAAIAYNGWSVATTGRDEWLAKVPISFRSFGDYKAPLAIYIVGAFTRVFSLELLAVRLPFAIAGVAAVIGMMLLTRFLWKLWVPKTFPRQFPMLDENQAALLVGALTATSSWHVHFSRVGFESGMALSFLIWGLVGVVYMFGFLKKPNVSLGVFSSGCIAASLYTYHSSKIVAPLLLVILFALLFKQLRSSWKSVLSWAVILGFLLLPLLIDSLFGKGADRFQQSTVFRLGYSPIQLISVLASHVVEHFRPSYLIQGATETLRHGDGKHGVLYLSEFFLAVVAVLGSAVHVVKSPLRSISKVSPLFWFSIAWIAIGVLPAAIGIDVPHSNRMLLALPGFLLLAALGWEWIAEQFKGELIAPALLGMTLLMQIFFVSSYLNYYYTTFAKTSANDFIDGYQEAVQYAIEHESEVDQILFTSKYQQPYIYTLIGRRTNVYNYHNGSLIKYLFTDTISNGDLARPKTLIVATPDQVDPRAADKLIYGSDGKIRFVLVKTP